MGRRYATADWERNPGVARTKSCPEGRTKSPPLAGTKSAPQERTGAQGCYAAAYAVCGPTALCECGSILGIRAGVGSVASGSTKYEVGSTKLRKFVRSEAAQECNISPKGEILSAQQKFSPLQVEILSQQCCEILSIFAENR